MKNKILSGIFGLCIADAVGVPVEFYSRKLLSRNPVTDMRGYGSYNQPAGTWSDDTSMTLCLLDSLSNGLDYTDIMQRFLSWLDGAKYTPREEVFDVGIASRDAVARFANGTPPLLCGGSSEYDNGNGSLMRILPLAFYLHICYGEDFFKHEDAVKIIHNVSSLTHAHKRSHIACGIYLSIAQMLIGGMKLQLAISLGVYRGWKYYSENPEYIEELAHYARLNEKEFKSLPESQIKSSGYVVDTLEAAIWCLLNTDSYESCILKAVNLGEDTDTVAAIAGGLAGMYYGYEAIPLQWCGQIAKTGYIVELCITFYNNLTRMGFKKISGYISCFETVDIDSDCRCHTEKKDNASFAEPYPKYDDMLVQFADEFTNSGLMDYSYIETLKRYGFELNNNLQNEIETADLVLTKAILSAYIRQERFCDGVWARAVEEGVFLKLLKHLDLLLK